LIDESSRVDIGVANGHRSGASPQHNPKAATQDNKILDALERTTALGDARATCNISDVTHHTPGERLFASMPFSSPTHSTSSQSLEAKRASQMSALAEQLRVLHESKKMLPEELHNDFDKQLAAIGRELLAVRTLAPESQ
jgi:hypothetical protein